jgi:hypothetical protein
VKNRVPAKARMTKSKKSVVVRTTTQVLAELNKGLKQNVAVSGTGGAKYFIGEDGNPQLNERYFVVPVTACIPPQRGIVSGSVSDLYRKKKKVHVSTVKIEFTVAHARGVNLAGAMCWTPRHKLAEVERGAEDGIPTDFGLGTKKEGRQALYTLDDLGFLDGRECSPYKLKCRSTQEVDGDGKHVLEYRLASANGLMFECGILDPDKGGPVGKVDWRFGGVERTGCRTVNASIPNGSGIPGDAVFEDAKFSGVWHINEDIEFMQEEGVHILFGKNLQATFEISSGSTVMGEGGNEKPVSVCDGLVKDVQVQVYYRS